MTRSTKANQPLGETEFDDEFAAEAGVETTGVLPSNSVG